MQLYDFVDISPWHLILSIALHLRLNVNRNLFASVDFTLFIVDYECSKLSNQYGCNYNFFMRLLRTKNRRAIACVITPNKVKLQVGCKLQIAACDRSANHDLNEIDRATKLNHDSLCAFDRGTCRDYDWLYVPRYILTFNLIAIL